MKNRNIRMLVCSGAMAATIIVLVCLMSRYGSFDGFAPAGGDVWGLGFVLVFLGGLLFWVGHIRMRYSNRAFEPELFAESPTEVRTQRAVAADAKSLAITEQPDENELFCAPGNTRKRDVALLRWTRAVQIFFGR